MKRDEMVAAMEERGTVWDVIIIGGGATGLGAAIEAASRGHRTVLVDAEDFAKGTSSRSTKLIHGGVRYLRQGRIGMVRQSLRERGLLFRNAPHLVRRRDFLLPAYRWGQRSLYYAGLRIYDLLAGQLMFGRARRLSRSETSEQLPTLLTDGLRGGVLYADGQFDDARLAMTLAMTATDHGAILANYMPVEKLLFEGQRVAGVILRDRESGNELQLRGRVVLNATGVFVENILRMDMDSQTTVVSGNRPKVAVSQGSHLVLENSFLPGSTALMIPETDDGRVLFAIPWHGKVLLGTTDFAVSEASHEPRPLRSEIDYLLEHAGRYLRCAPKESDIRSCFSGLRPLVGAKSGAASTSQLSREHEICTSASGLISVIGGKWTTYRQMGEDLVNHAERTSGLRRLKSRTASLALHGCPHDAASVESELSSMSIYGTDVSGIESLIQERPELADRIHPRLPYRAAEVVWSVRHEMARTVEDVLARRTRALFLHAQAAMEAANPVAELLGLELRRSDTWQREQIDTFQTLAANYCGKRI